MIFSSLIKTPLGQMQVSASEEFLVSALFIKTQIQSGLNLTQTKEKSSILTNAICQIQEYFDGKLSCFEIPIKQDGTGFQQTVWKELQNIPFGKTLGYLELAIRLGNPKSIRAAASANGKNNIAIIVPCHRVIGSDGKLVGYAGDLWRKKWLLDHEAKISGKSQQLKLFEPELQSNHLNTK